jgi:DNA-binding GntR family transcriptional regulator
MTEEPSKTEEKQKRRGALLVHDALRDDILWLRIRPGEAIDEVALAKRFAVSRTPVREALLLLQGEGLVEFLPNRTSIVAPLSMNNAGQYFDTLLVLARSVARAAAMSGRADATVFGGMLSAHRDCLAGGDLDGAFRCYLSLMRQLSATTGNIFFDRYFSHCLDAGMRTKILHFFPHATAAELEDHARRLDRLFAAVSDGDADASDREIASLISSEIEITLRALRPEFGADMDLGETEMET